MTTLYHTSTGKITKIEKGNTSFIFDDVLFFAYSPYYLGPSSGKELYSMEVDDSELVYAYDLPADAKAIKLITDRLYYGFDVELSEDEAFDILTTRGDDAWKDIICEKKYDDDNDLMTYEEDSERLADFSWKMQMIKAHAAQRAGYLGVLDIDEQGDVAIIPMFGKESRLVLEEWE